MADVKTLKEKLVDHRRLPPSCLHRKLSHRGVPSQRDAYEIFARGNQTPGEAICFRDEGCDLASVIDVVIDKSVTGRDVSTGAFQAVKELGGAADTGKRHHGGSFKCGSLGCRDDVGVQNGQ